MAIEEEPTNPFTRPGFIVSAVVVAVIAVIAAGVGVSSVLAPTPAETAAVTAETSASARSSAGAQGEGTSPTPAPTPVSDSEPSVCGLPGEVTSDARLGDAPQAEWNYDGTIAYPASPEYGPGATAAEGYRYCFQHSPQGALVAAANAAAQGSSPELAGEWIAYFLSQKSPNRDELIGQVASGGSGDTRVGIVGFKLLSYDGAHARVDLASQAMSQGKAVYMSVVYALVWEDGDWKILPDDPSVPLPLALIPNAAGYIPWSA